MEERYVASMELAGVGDAMGYRNGRWEFCMDGELIHNEASAMGGVAAISLHGWMVSDDTVMHLATAEALVDAGQEPKLDDVMKRMASAYVECFNDMEGRAPGNTTGDSIRILQRSGRWDSVPYSPSKGGCGGSMRAMSIGLRFFGNDQRDMLVAVSVESGRLTHTHPTGFLGALAAAAFTALAIEGVPPRKWGRLLLDDFIPRAKKYCEKNGRHWKDLEGAFQEAYFENNVKEFLRDRGIEDGNSEPTYPPQFLESPSQRDRYYTKFAFRKSFHGGSGDDSIIIALDAILACQGDWIQFAKIGILHGGDNDSTGCIGASWFGALWGFNSVPTTNLNDLEYRDRLKALGKRLYAMTHTNAAK